MEYWVNVILLFFVYGFAGWCMEVILKYRQYHRFINRGFLTGPICPIYGSGQPAAVYSSADVRQAIRGRFSDRPLMDI